MKITRSSDWRASLAFDIPARVSDIVPGDPAKCALCPYENEPLDRDQLWVVKQKNPKDPAGIARFYCTLHVPIPAPPAPAPEPKARARKASSPREPRTTVPRRLPVDEPPRSTCPDCFIEVPPSGLCGMCGEKIA